MTQMELVREIAERAQISLPRAEAAVAALHEIILREVAAGRSVRLLGIGAFASRKVSERTVRLPNRRPMHLAASTTPHFRISDAWKQRHREMCE